MSLTNRRRLVRHTTLYLKNKTIYRNFVGKYVIFVGINFGKDVGDVKFLRALIRTVTYTNKAILFVLTVRNRARNVFVRNKRYDAKFAFYRDVTIGAAVNYNMEKRRILPEVGKDRRH